MSVIVDPARSLEQRLELVAQTGLLLARNTHLESIVQRATDTGLQVTGAEFGGFVCNQTAPHPGSFAFYTVSGSGPTRSSTFPARTTLAAPLKDRAIIRSRDIGRDTRFRGPLAADGLPHDTHTIRSYLAVPVRVLSGEILGALVYGHEDPDTFDETSELLIGTIASQAAFAIENSRMREQLSRKLAEMDRIEVQRKTDVKRLGELAAIVESSEDAIVSKDLNGIITSWNQAATRILGYTADEIVGQSVLKLIPEELQSDEPVILSRIRAGQRIEHFDTVRRSKSGELLDVSLTISPVKDDSGTIIGASKILRDISSRKRIETSLIQAEKIAATGRMAATIAHEINNPLEAVLNLLYLLRQQVETTDGKAYLGTAEIELTRVAHIAKQTLGYYREHTSAVSCSISQLAEHALTVYSPRCSAYDITIESHLESSTRLTVRRGEMVQVISNLLANAIAAMPEGGKLKVSVVDTRTPSPGVCLVVEDNGVGIPEENLTKVFDAFFTTRVSVGTGIGLFVARQFVEGHGGRITIESSTDPEDHGTKLSVFIPLQTAYEQTAEAPASAP
jgi:PAS domain S-box-containing protein